MPKSDTLVLQNVSKNSKISKRKLNGFHITGNPLLSQDQNGCLTYMRQPIYSLSCKIPVKETVLISFGKELFLYNFGILRLVDVAERSDILNIALISRDDRT